MGTKSDLGPPGHARIYHDVYDPDHEVHLVFFEVIEGSIEDKKNTEHIWGTPMSVEIILSKESFLNFQRQIAGVTKEEIDRV